jgi:hypothetical protein
LARPAERHISLARVAIDGSTVRVVRDSGGSFNISELMPTKPGGGRAVDVTVDEFTLARGTVLLEDRSLSPWRTWWSEDLAFQARNSPRSAMTGRPTPARRSVRIEQLRLKPVPCARSCEPAMSTSRWRGSTCLRTRR